MNHQHTTQLLQEEFPDMSQSIIGDILHTYQGNRDAAAAALGGINKDKKYENEKKIKELQDLFPFASEEDCKEVLVSTNWDVEAAIVPLFNRGEELKQKARREKEMELVKKREAEAKKKSENLLEVFNTISKDEIQTLLDENEGDIEETTNQLLTIVAKQEEEKTKKKQATVKAEEKRMQEEQEMRLRELKIQALEEKFDDLSEKEVILALESADWDIKKAHLELMKVSSEKKKKYLKSLFSSLKDNEIENALDCNDWDKGRAATYLTEQLREKRTAPVVVKKTQQNLLERSLVFAQQIEDQVTQSHADFERALKEESMATFKKDLEHIMKVQARHGFAPGMAPPLPKQIDDILGKNKEQPIEEPVQAQVQENSQQQEEQKLFQDQMQDGSKFVVLLSVPTVVDIGNTINVSWEMTTGESTPNDWIGMFLVDQPNKQYLTYQWRGKNDANKGSVTFTAPSVYGVYEFRYFIDRSYQHVAISNQLTIGPKVEVEANIPENGKILVKWNQLSGNKYSRAWIGLYEKSQTNQKLYITWEYASAPEIYFPAPVKPREYEFRFFTNSYVPVTQSNSILIEGEDYLSASISNGIITVKPHIVSVDPYCDSVWVGIFFISEKDHRQWRRYKYVVDRDAEITFKAPRTPGEYEVRLFANKTYDLIVKSNSFTIEKK